MYMTFDWMSITVAVGGQDNKYKELGNISPTVVVMEGTLNVGNTGQSSK
jgi:hypothetical protein